MKSKYNVDFICPPLETAILLLYNGLGVYGGYYAF